MAVQTLPSSSCTILVPNAPHNVLGFSCTLWRLPPPTCLSKFKPFSQFTDVCHSCTVHAPNVCSALCIHENLLCVCQRHVGGRLNAGVSGVNPISGPNVAMYRIQIAMLPCTIVQNPDSRCLEHLSFPSPSMPSFINHLYCTRG